MIAHGLARGVKAKRVQCDGIWSFTYAKQKNVATAKAAPDGSVTVPDMVAVVS